MLASQIPAFLTVLGAFTLSMALRTTHKICHLEHVQERGWKILFVLIVFFIVGYLSLAYSFLLPENNFELNLLITMILFAGSIFVLLVTHMSYLSISEIKQLAASERVKARHDELTDLPNRTLLYETIKNTIRDAEKNQQPIAILLMDLDRFKEINDTLGHHYGDALLKLVAPRLMGAIRNTDTVCRMGGDEFAVVLPGARNEEAMKIARGIAEAMEDSFFINNHNLNVGISIGISVYPDHGKNTESLIKCADIAMYVAKRAGIQYEVYHPEKDRHTINRLNLVGEILNSIHENHFILYYQPIINIKHQNIVGVEALIRWQHTDRGLILPDEFIGPAERSGLIKQLTSWVLEKSIEQCSIWQKQGLALSVAVNLSTKNLQDTNLPAQIYRLLTRWKVNPNKLVLEITESSIMQNPIRAFEVISTLHSLGVHLAIDDFGTGYSSLSYLKQIPMGEIKIDRSFVMNMLDDDNDAIIVRSTIDLAHNMGRSVLAEGVENQDILDILDILGCDRAQGFHLCKPIPAHELSQWVQQSQWQARRA